MAAQAACSRIAEHYLIAWLCVQVFKVSGHTAGGAAKPNWGTDEPGWVISAVKNLMLSSQ